MTAEQAYQVIGAFYQAVVESRDRECDFNEFAAQKIWELAEELTKPKPMTGVLMAGKVGNGKTTLMFALDGAMRYLSDKGYYKYDFGIAHKADFGLRIRTAKEIVNTVASDQQGFDRLKSFPFLGIDELGEEPRDIMMYGNEIRPMVDLLEYRYSRQLFTCVTTNLDPKEISEKYGTRVQDRLREMLKVISFGNFRSYR